METAQLPIHSQAAYLAARKGLIGAREGLFGALQAYLRPEQRPDASRLGDPLANSKARAITESDWIANPVRGYLVVLESAPAGRPFRLSVLQQGFELRIGVRYLQKHGQDWDVERRIRDSFKDIAPLVKSRPPFTTIDWHFDARDLYQSAQAFEDAVFKVGAVFESALQALVAADQPQ